MNFAYQYFPADLGHGTEAPFGATKKLKSYFVDLGFDRSRRWCRLKAIQARMALVVFGRAVVVEVRHAMLDDVSRLVNDPSTEYYRLLVRSEPVKRAYLSLGKVSHGIISC
jgi:hypothetical protein